MFKVLVFYGPEYESGGATVQINSIYSFYLALNYEAVSTLIMSL